VTLGVELKRPRHRRVAARIRFLCDLQKRWRSSYACRHRRNRPHRQPFAARVLGTGLEGCLPKGTLGWLAEFLILTPSLRSFRSAILRVKRMSAFGIRKISLMSNRRPWRELGKDDYPAAITLWISATTAAPSPTAAATRFVDPARTSPTAKTPGRLVSSGRTGW
jgi:hypothetical protein